MEKCIHVSKIRPAWDHSILNPEKWLCFICHTTESVWACLSCSNVACGRFNEQHALKHFQDCKHPISIEVNDKYVYCYVCDDYVLNDNAAGDIKLLRSALSAIATQTFTDIESRGRRLLRSYSHSGVIQRELADEDDKIVTAEWHQRQRLLGKVFSAWRTYVYNQKLLKQSSSKKQKKKPEAAPSVSLKKRTIIPGVTGLRNLGNTCYMNSVLQVLSHIDAFRDFFLSLKNYFDSSPSISPQVSSLMKSLSSNKSSVRSSPKESSSKLIIRQTTVECFQHLMSTRSKAQNASSQRQLGGLNGGSAPSTSRRRQLICEVEAKGTGDKNVSLCSELLGLFRVLWSGKWAQVSPHAFLQAVWQAIPLFKGYAQHDAQEFLCELLDKVQTELDCVPRPLQPEDSHLVTELFQGELVSQVTCEACRKLSRTYELFLDLSLEFPDRYQITKQNSRIAQDVCHVTEMLAKFTEVEDLEGQIYACENCNSRKGKQKETIYTEARKQLLINKFPQILRLHLKRFRWSGRYHREKISTHVAFDENLDLTPFCSETLTQTCHEYQLFAVIIHHGKGFGSGHYTAYTWNSEAESWVNCNDSRMHLSGTEEVLMSQAYILFYRAVTDKLPLLTKISSSNTSVCSLNSTDTLPYSLKPDGTFILDDEEDCSWQNQFNSSPPNLKKECLKEEETQPSTSPRMCLDSSDTVNSFVEIDNEISFKESPNTSFVKCQDTSAIDTKVSEKGIRGQKRSQKLSEDAFVSPGKRKKKMSFSTEMFYPQKLEPIYKGQDMSDSAFKSSQMKLDKSTHTPSKIPPKSPGHIKRRKSAFW